MVAPYQQARPVLSGSREEKLRAQGVPPAIIASMRSFEEQQLEQKPARAPSLGPQLSEQAEQRAVEQGPAQASETGIFPSTVCPAGWCFGAFQQCCSD